MKSELSIRKIGDGRFNVTDNADPTFEMNDINDAQLYGYLKNRELLGTTAEAVMDQFDLEGRKAVEVIIDRSFDVARHVKD